MSNTVSKFLHCSTNDNYFLLIAHNDNAASATMHFNDYKCIANATLFLSFPNGENTDSVELSKDQITHLLSLDCPDAFIAYALTLCPCPPETSDTALSSTDDVDGGILVITKRLKEIKEEINLLNGIAFQNTTLTDAQHYQLLDVEMFIDDFIAPYSYREVIQ